MCVPSYLCPLRGAGSSVTSVVSGTCNNQVSDPQYSFLPKDSRPLREEADSRGAEVSWNVLLVKTWRRLRAADGVSQRTWEQSSLTFWPLSPAEFGIIEYKDCSGCKSLTKKDPESYSDCSHWSMCTLLRIILTRIIKWPVFILEF